MPWPPRGHGCRPSSAKGPASLEAASTSTWPYAPPWGFAPEDIGVPVCIFQGGADELVPASWGATLADRIPGAGLVAFPGEGHFIALTRSKEILDYLAKGDQEPAGS